MLCPLLFAGGLGLVGIGSADHGFAQDTAAQPPAGGGATDGGAIVARDGTVVLIQDVQVPAQVEGMLTEMMVEEGARVEEGQELARLDDRDARLALELKIAEEKEARLNAENEINRKYAEQSRILSEEKATAFEDLAKDRIMAKWEARQARLEAFRDGLQVELADINQEIARAQYGAKQVERQIAEQSLEKRRIRAPFAGFVETRFAQLGEWVQPGTPIVKLVQMDRLRAEAFLDYEVANRVSIGMPAVVQFTLGGGRTERINARVGYVSSDLTVDDKRRVWVEFENRKLGSDWLIKPGMKPSILINTQQ